MRNCPNGKDGKMKRTVDMTPKEAIQTGNDHRYRFWDGEQMHDGSSVHVHPTGQVGKDMAIMWSTGWKDAAETNMYEGDVVIDCDGCRGVIVFWREECCFAILYPLAGYPGNKLIDDSSEPGMLAMAEFSPGQFRVLGNIYEHPDWENWE